MCIGNPRNEATSSSYKPAAAALATAAAAITKPEPEAVAAGLGKDAVASELTVKPVESSSTVFATKASNSKEAGTPSCKDTPKGLHV